MRKVSLILIVLLVLGAATVGWAGGGELPPQSQATGSPPLYDQVSIWQYRVDGDSSYQQNGNKQALLTINSLLTGKAWLIHTAIRSAEYAVSLRFLEPLASPVAQVTQKLTAQFWQGSWLTAGLAIVGLTALLAWVFRRKSRAYQLLAFSVGVLFVSVWLAAQADLLVQGASKSGAGIADIGIQTIADAAVLARPASTTNVGGSVQALIRSAGEALWKTHVLQPWVNLEFGSEKNGEFYTQDGITGGAFLALDPSDRQQRYFQQTYQQRQERFAWWSEDYAVQRMVLSLVGIVTAGLTVIPLFLLSGGILFYQLLFVVIVLLAPIWLLLALWWPDAATWALRRLLLRGLGAVVLPVILGMLLGVMMFLFAVTGDMAVRWGWMFAALVQATVGLVIYRYRYEWVLLIGSRPSRRVREATDHQTPGVMPQVATTSRTADVMRRHDMSDGRKSDPRASPNTEVSLPSGPAFPPTPLLPVTSFERIAERLQPTWMVTDEHRDTEHDPLTEFQTNLLRVHQEMSRAEPHVLQKNGLPLSAPLMSPQSDLASVFGDRSRLTVTNKGR